ncbi:hypothetical protein [Amycolatopsis roodepoortensis]|uniref:hypothetical protein n=1 Tax=Amycolatopsis roodepoortensis TaxID=700274 RepID=UPI0027D861FF|nr:hypothetical protein [Amycolatopsis roodepoortensis]
MNTSLRGTKNIFRRVGVTALAATLLTGVAATTATAQEDRPELRQAVQEFVVDEAADESAERLSILFGPVVQGIGEPAEHGLQYPSAIDVPSGVSSTWTAPSVAPKSNATANLSHTSSRTCDTQRAEF